MERREVIRLVSLATGAAISAPLMGSLFTSCKKEVEKTDENYTLLFFKEDEFNMVTSFVDTILPKTDSPSATDVGVHKIIDNMVAVAYRPNEKKAYAEKISSLMEFLSEKNFSSLDSAQQKEVLKDLNKNSSEEIKAAYLELKQQTIAYYLSTEEIGEKYLNYLPVPGKYEPCITLEEAGGKAWAI